MEYKLAYVVMQVHSLNSSVIFGANIPIPIIRVQGNPDVQRMAKNADLMISQCAVQSGIGLHDLGQITFQCGSDIATVMGDELRELHAQRQK